MKLLITIIFFIIGVKINAMNLLDYKVNEKKVILEDWKFFSDQVMGGVSEGKTALKKDKNKFFLRLEGTVSTENNGGFIQVRKEYVIKEANKFRIAARRFYAATAAGSSARYLKRHKEVIDFVFDKNKNNQLPD